MSPVSWSRRLWSAEVDATRAARARWLPPAVVACVVVYIFVELLLVPPSDEFATLADLRMLGTMPLAWIALVAVTFAVRLAVSVVGYFVHAERVDRVRLRRNLMVYAPAAGIQVLLAAAVAAVATTLWPAVELAGVLHVLEEAVDRWVPTLVELPAMPWAIFLGWTLYSFTAYFVHWLGHRSRLLWHVCHAPHHLPDYLHPLGAPLAFGFDFLVWIPRVACATLAAKLFASEPLVLEVGLLALCAYCFEIFNHSSVHYELCQRNRLLRFATSLFGGHGAYHYVHHSSAREHQVANLGGGAFLMWDRLLGTFVEPPRERPAIGWTGDPAIRLNPLRVVFGGAARIAYELRHNPGLAERLRIVFGPIDYMPPRTRDFVTKPPAPAQPATLLGYVGDARVEASNQVVG